MQKARNLVKSDLERIYDRKGKKIKSVEGKGNAEKVREREGKFESVREVMQCVNCDMSE